MRRDRPLNGIYQQRISVFPMHIQDRRGDYANRTQCGIQQVYGARAKGKLFFICYSYILFFRISRSKEKLSGVICTRFAKLDLKSHVQTDAKFVNYLQVWQTAETTSTSKTNTW